MDKQILPRFIDIRQARKMYSLSRCKILELIYNRDIIATKKCGKWLIETQSIENFLKEDYNKMELKMKKFFEEIMC